MAEINLTKAAVEAIEVPAKGKVRVRDTRQPGLVVTVLPSGLRTFYYYAMHDYRVVERKLGRYPTMTVEQARQAAAVVRAELSQGIDSRKTKSAEQTFGELWQWWYDQHAAPTGAAKRLQSDRSLWRLHLAPVFEHRRLNTITRTDLRAHHLHIGNTVGHRTANMAIGMVRAVWNKAIIYELTQLPNAADKLPKFPEPKRERRMMPAEAAAFFEAVAAAKPDVRDFVLLLLYTGARRGNVQQMRWDQIDWDARTWRIPRTKNGKPQTIPLEDAELELLRERLHVADGVSEYVFPARRGSSVPYLTEPKKAWHALLARAGIEDFHMHDLRRTLASFMADTGATLHVVGSALGHSSPAATQIYARLQLDPIRLAKRRALEAIDEAKQRPQ